MISGTVGFLDATLSAGTGDPYLTTICSPPRNNTAAAAADASSSSFSYSEPPLQEINESTLDRTLPARTKRVVPLFLQDLQTSHPSRQRIHLRVFLDHLPLFLEADDTADDEWDALLFALFAIATHRRMGLTPLQRKHNLDASDVAMTTLHRLLGQRHAKLPIVLLALDRVVAQLLDGDSGNAFERFVDPVESVAGIPRRDFFQERVVLATTAAKEAVVRVDQCRTSASVPLWNAELKRKSSSAAAAASEPVSPTTNSANSSSPNFHVTPQHSTGDPNTKHLVGYGYSLDALPLADRYGLNESQFTAVETWFLTCPLLSARVSSGGGGSSSMSSSAVIALPDQKRNILPIGCRQTDAEGNMPTVTVAGRWVLRPSLLTKLLKQHQKKSQEARAKAAKSGANKTGSKSNIKKGSSSAKLTKKGSEASVTSGAGVEPSLQAGGGDEEDSLTLYLSLMELLQLLFPLVCDTVLLKRIQGVVLVPELIDAPWPTELSLTNSAAGDGKNEAVAVGIAGGDEHSSLLPSWRWAPYVSLSHALEAELSGWVARRRSGAARSSEAYRVVRNILEWFSLLDTGSAGVLGYLQVEAAGFMRHVPSPPRGSSLSSPGSPIGSPMDAAAAEGGRSSPASWSPRNPSSERPQDNEPQPQEAVPTPQSQWTTFVLSLFHRLRRRDISAVDIVLQTLTSILSDKEMEAQDEAAKRKQKTNTTGAGAGSTATAEPDDAAEDGLDNVKKVLAVVRRSWEKEYACRVKTKNLQNTTFQLALLKFLEYHNTQDSDGNGAAEPENPAGDMETMLSPSQREAQRSRASVLDEEACRFVAAVCDAVQKDCTATSLAAQRVALLAAQDDDARRQQEAQVAVAAGPAAPPSLLDVSGFRVNRAILCLDAFVSRRFWPHTTTAAQLETTAPGANESVDAPAEWAAAGDSSCETERLVVDILREAVLFGIPCDGVFLKSKGVLHLLLGAYGVPVVPPRLRHHQNTPTALMRTSTASTPSSSSSSWLYRRRWSSPNPKPDPQRNGSWMVVYERLALHYELDVHSGPSSSSSTVASGHQPYGTEGSVYRDFAFCTRRPPNATPSRASLDAADIGLRPPSDEVLHLITNIPLQSNIKYRFQLEGYNFGINQVVNSIVVGFASKNVEIAGSLEAFGWPDGWDEHSITHLAGGIQSITQYFSTTTYVRRAGRGNQATGVDAPPLVVGTLNAVPPSNANANGALPNLAEGEQQSWETAPVLCFEIKAKSLQFIGFSVSAWLCQQGYGEGFPVSAAFVHQVERV